MAIYLQITQGTKDQQVRLGPRPIFIGRSSKCHITVNDNMVSGKHLAIKINSDNHVVIKDLATTNGTYLNGNKIDESLLYLDDFIQIGKVKITLIPTDMTSQELKIHQRDFERTNVTFVKLGNQVSASHDEDDSEFGFSQQQNLLAKIREKRKQVDPDLSVTRPQTVKEREEVEQPSITFTKDELPESARVEDIPPIKKAPPSKAKKGSRKEDLVANDLDEDEFIEEDEDNGGLVSKVKGLFNKS